MFSGCCIEMHEHSFEQAADWFDVIQERYFTTQTLLGRNLPVTNKINLEKQLWIVVKCRGEMKLHGLKYPRYQAEGDRT